MKILFLPPLLRSLFKHQITLAAGLLFILVNTSAVASPPQDSGIHKILSDHSLVLVHAFDDAQSTDLGRHNIRRIESSIYPGQPGKIGTRTVKLYADAAHQGGKATFWIGGQNLDEAKMYGMWVYLENNHNVRSLGLEVTDADGEMLLATTQAPSGGGWHWIEFDVDKDFRPSFNQPDHSGVIDFPLRRIGVVWFADSPGDSVLGVDGLVAARPADEVDPALRISPNFAGPFFYDQPLQGSFIINNPTNQEHQVTIRYQIQRDSFMNPTPPPHPEHGTNIAFGKGSKTIFEGEVVEEGSLTDGERHTAYETPWGQGSKGAVQIIDLGDVFTVTHMALQNSDAGWMRQVDVSYSSDGENYSHVDDLQGIDFRSAYQTKSFPEFAPFQARYIRFSYHDGGEGVQKLALPSQIEIFDGVDNETWEAPQTGEVVTQADVRSAVPARSFEIVNVGSEEPLGPGGYLVSWKIHDGEKITGGFTHAFVDTPAVKEIHPNGRFGMNVNNTIAVERMRDMGISWLRFENHKWDMTSPAPGEFRFDGSVGPWHVPHDEYYRVFRENGLQILPYLFHTPSFHSTAPEGSRREAQYPPEDLELYYDFAFQSAARYGSKEHSPDVLKTNDKKSGLDKIRVYSIWNEPNLDSPDWGHWVAPLDKYFEMFRIGARGIKDADPDAQVATAGFAGIGLDLIDRLATYTYEDGTNPTDYIDVLNVHHYTGRRLPETSRVNVNIQRGQDVVEGLTFEEELKMLDHWRNQNIPGKEIWMTETGFDNRGPVGIGYRNQAARIPRKLMIILGSGLDRVHLFRITGDRDGRYASSGILDHHGNPKPSYYTMATMIKEIDGYDEAYRLPVPDESIRLYIWRKGSEVVVSGWSLEGHNPIGLNLGETTVTDSFGHRQRKDVDESYMLGEFPVYFRDIENISRIGELYHQAKQERQDYMEKRDELANAFAVGFDFGKGEDIGSFDLGLPRRMIAVTEGIEYDSDRRYGFRGNLDTIRSEERRWISDPRATDHLRIPNNTSFMVNLDRGEYVMDIAAGGNTSFDLVDANGRQTIDFDGEVDYLRFEIRSDGNPIQLDFRGYRNSLRWLRIAPLEVANDLL